MATRKRRDPVISVIVPVYNSQTTLGRCLEALERLSYPAYEVIIVDDGSTDGTAVIAKEYASRNKNFSYMRQNNAGPACARNAGARTARGSVLAFTDSDCVAEKGWLSHAEKHFKDTGIAGVEGRIDTGKIGILTQSIKVEKGGRYLTANMFYRKKQFLQEGGFDERFKFAFREDTDMGLRMLKRGRIVFEGKACVYHTPRGVTFFRLLKKQKMYFYEALFVKKHGIRASHALLDSPQARARAALTTLALLPMAFLVPEYSAYFIFTFAAYVAATAAYFLYIMAKEKEWNLSNILFLPFSFTLPFLTLYWLARGSIKFGVLAI